jgi:hypothetical protein
VRLSPFFLCSCDFNFVVIDDLILVVIFVAS